MAFCGNCGTQVEDGLKFCPSCGKEIGGAPAQQPVQQEPPAQSQYQQDAQFNPSPPPAVPDTPEQAQADDAKQNMVMGILAYIVFFVPMIVGVHKTSPFVKFHTNQGFMVFVLNVGFQILSGILRLVIKVPYYPLGRTSIFGELLDYSGVQLYRTPVFLTTFLWLVSIPLFALCVIGIINAINGKIKPLPVIGNLGITIVK